MTGRDNETLASLQAPGSDVTGRRKVRAVLGAVLLSAAGVATIGTAGTAHSAPAGKIACEGQQGNPNGDSEVYVMNADGGGLTYLTRNDVRDGDPSLSTDGRVAFESYRDGNSEVWVMNDDGTGVRQVTYTVGGENRGTSWSSDNRQVAFHSTRTGIGATPHGNFEIYKRNANTDESTEPSIQLTDGNPAQDAQPDWSPDRTKIAFNSTRTVTPEIHVMNADGTGLTALTLGSVESSGPAWSPDGTKIAFQGRQDGVVSHEIYVMNANGTQLTRLTNNDAFDAFSDWSPDGSRIVFTSNRDGDYEVYTMNADGSDVRRLTNLAGFDGRCSWRASPEKR